MKNKNGKIDQNHPEPKNPYLDDNGNPNLRRSIVAFVDILGYSQMTCYAVDNGQSHEFLSSLRATFIRAFHHLQIDFRLWSNLPVPWVTKTFTDNIVIGYPLPCEDNGLALAIVTRRLGEFQLEMTLGGFFLRGAVVVGDLYIDDQMVFGPALIDAYKAEKHARDPRIILTESVVRGMEDQRRQDHSTGETWQDYLLLRDPDRVTFVNYLDGVVAYEKDMGYPDVIAMESHRDIIRQRLIEFAEDPSRWIKYLWAARYHNYFCDERYDFPDELKVDLSSMNVHPVRLSATS